MASPPAASSAGFRVGAQYLGYGLLFLLAGFFAKSFMAKTEDRVLFDSFCPAP